MAELRRKYRGITFGTCFSVRDLFRTVKLEDIISTNKFRIVGCNPGSYNQLDIMPVPVMDEELFHLNNEIHRFVKDPASTFKGIPVEYDIVLAKKPEEAKYNRGVLTHVMGKNEELGVVCFIDIGGTACLEISSLKGVNEAIMKFPVLSYNVSLEGLNKTSPLLLLADFEKCIHDLAKVDFTVELCKRLYLTAPLTYGKSVKLTYKESAKSCDLVDLIKSKEKWEWEKYSNLTGTDDEICQNEKFGDHRAQNFLVRLHSLHNYRGFTAEVSQIFMDEKNKKFANLKLVLLSHPRYKDDFNVLHHQLDRYAKYIKKSAFYPAVHEPCMFKLKDKKEFEGKARCMGKWLRAVRCSMEMMYLLDLDDTVPFKHLDDEDYEIRRLHPELYLRMPCLSIDVRPTSGGIALSIDQANEMFKIKERYHFVVTKSAEGKPCEVSFELL